MFLNNYKRFIESQNKFNIIDQNLGNKIKYLTLGSFGFKPFAPYKSDYFGDEIIVAESHCPKHHVQTLTDVKN